ncbi:MAG TPA: menaquinone-dependent protoporphyrinogen IX dehydrogenase [Steroidobacteraceae bacterium]|nr:menaquinone-dependent protoporphyrinogen IX dehydrogenase [Steroidobacteraceae bacterium]
MTHILLLYHGIYGHTRKISEALAAGIAEEGGHADVVPLADAGSAKFESYDAIVIGAAIRNGKHNPSVIEFIRTQRPLLEAKPSAFFSVNLVARKPIKNTPETNPYVRKFIASSPWKPELVGVFAGNLDYQRYGFFDRHIIRFIMRLTGGPTDLSTNIEFTNWDEVRRFATRVQQLAGGSEH